MTITVCIDSAPGVTFEAATLQEGRWNGWERPTFTRPQADIVAAWFTRRAHQGYPTITYDAAADAYTITYEDGEVTTHEATETGTYALGDAAWCWERFTRHPALAAEELADTWVRSRILSDLGARLTCPEAEALATLLRATGFSDEARALIAQHATTDDDPDVDSH